MRALLAQKPHLIRLPFCGEILYLDGRKAAYWPKEKTLLLADLHLGKARAFDAQGFNLPNYDTQETLNRLQVLIALYQPQTVIFLGDSFHREHSWQQLSHTDRETCCEIIQAIPECIWILGNHDPSIPDSLPGTRCSTITRSGILLCHDGSPTEQPQILGHFHPKCRFRLVRIHKSAPCFAHAPHQLILPAFGAFTGGLSMHDPALRAFIQPSEAFVCYEEKIWALPRSRWRH